MIVALALTLGTSTLRTVMVADPSASAVTTPVALTLATFGVLDVHVTALDAPGSAMTCAVSCLVAPANSVALVGVTERPLTVGVVTVIADVALTYGFATLVAVIVAAPGASAVTSPAPFTVAMADALDPHVSAVLAPASASTVAVGWRVPATSMLTLTGATVTPRTTGATALTMTDAVACTVGVATLVTVTVDVPGETPLTTPDAETVATLCTEEVHVSVVAVPASATSVAVRGREAPTSTCKTAGNSVS